MNSLARARATPQDLVVSDRLDWVLSGGDNDIVDMLNENDLILMERKAFIDLAGTDATLARVQHMLETGKPLRN